MKQLFTDYEITDEEEILGHLNRLPGCYEKYVQGFFDEITNKLGDKEHKHVKTLPSPSSNVASKREKIEKMEICTPSIKTSNKYQVLAELDKEKSQSSITDIPIMKKSKTKPPPIIVKDKKNWPAICQLLKNTNSSSDKNFNDKDGIKMIFNEMTTFEKCLQTLGQHKIDHFTFNKEKGSEIRAIFEGVAEDFSIEDITNDLKSKGFHPRVVARFKNRDGRPMPIILCIVPDEDQDIKNLKMIMDVNVKFERQRRKVRTSQCYNCQTFGHTAHTCSLPPVCRHCSGQHESRAHPIDQDIENECSNCKGNHKSNYRGCPSYPIVKNNEETNNARRPLRPPRPQEERKRENRRENPGTTEDKKVRELLAAMDELRELIIRRPILAGLIQLKNCQGAEASPSSD
ncbi:hypothetical protein JTB14_000767 [Gonioctena quinquepunctata]|nr:hypothetical protein JTB14_000767 [Gonioctena quinquepunctata]